MNTLAIIERERYVKEILSDARYQIKSVWRNIGFKVYSQNDEDGIIQEIFIRIGQGPRTFVAFGVENGLENNTLKLLLKVEFGLWIDGSESNMYRKSMPNLTTSYPKAGCELKPHLSIATALTTLLGRLSDDDRHSVNRH